MRKIIISLQIAFLFCGSDFAVAQERKTSSPMQSVQSKAEKWTKVQRPSLLTWSSLEGGADKKPASDINALFAEMRSSTTGQVAPVVTRKLNEGVEFINEKDIIFVKEARVTKRSQADFLVSECEVTVNSTKYNDVTTNTSTWRNYTWYVSDPKSLMWCNHHYIIPVGSTILIRPSKVSGEIKVDSSFPGGFQWRNSHWDKTNNDDVTIFGYKFRKGSIKITNDGLVLQPGTEVVLKTALPESSEGWPAKTCRDECIEMYKKGELRKGMTIDQCDQTLCK